MIATDDVDLLAKKLRDAHVRFISPGVVAMPKDKAGFSKGALVSDPDGHDVLLIGNNVIDFLHDGSIDAKISLRAGT